MIGISPAQADQGADGAAAAAAVPLGPRRWGMIVVLMTFSLLSLLDKMMFALLINLIGPDLGLSDVQLSLLQGLAFALLYALGTLAFGWAVDRYSPRVLLFGATILWSLAAAASGLATTFGELFVARALVGLGEGVVFPATFRLVSRHVPGARLGFINAVLAVGTGAGAVCALLFGSSIIQMAVHAGGMDLALLGHRGPWQSAFIVTGLPGIAIAFLAFLLPARNAAPDPAAVAARVGDAPEDAAFLPFVRARWPLVLGHMGAWSMLGMASFCLTSWSPAYLGRAFHWDHERIGLTIALGVASGMVGNLLWGALIDRLRARGARSAVYGVHLVLALIGVPCAILAYTAATPGLFILFNSATWMSLIAIGALPAGMQIFTPPALVGQMSGLQTFCMAVFGTGVAPVLVAVVTQYVFADTARLGDSLALVLAFCGVAGALFLWLALRSTKAVATTDQAAAQPVAGAAA